MRTLFSALMVLFLTCLPVWADATPDAVPSPQVIVVGGGIAGLISAWKLEQKGYRTCVLEATDRLGGRIGTAHYADGLEAEFGMQEIWEKSPLVGIVRDLGLELESTDDAWSSLIIDDHLYPFIQDTREAYLQKLFTPAERKPYDEAIKAMEDLNREANTQGLTPRIQALQKMSFQEWLKARHLPHKVEEALRLTIEVELAWTDDDFSALSAILEYRTFLFGGEKNYHVKGGNSQIIARLAAAIQGPKIMNARVTHILRHQENGRWVAEVRYIKDDTVHSMKADCVVCAVPWVTLHLIQFQPNLTPMQVKAFNSLGRGQYTVVHMILNKDVQTLWKNVGGNPFPILSDGVLGVIYGPHATDTQGPDMIFSLLIYGPQATAYHMISRDTKKAEVLKGLEHYWPGFSKYVKEVQFYSYHPCAVSFWHPGRSPLDNYSEAIRTPHAGLFLAGDWTESSHSEGAVISALKTADKVDHFMHAAVK
jgi:monoamine oxidase